MTAGPIGLSKCRGIYRFRDFVCF